ncbi:hypothetical protein ATI02_3204 [Pseudomonas baetica]|uniref:Uncharacterized protein n=1 Tax=Pseudomonas baetica TaxID=674054 RepID=A0ABX4Q0I8_9PSED|nr:hypothetical protein [Pseudomonas baetica]PKA70309.1 hypothetical protein ATI02_3204 [Pseudomonas baetica]
MDLAKNPDRNWPLNGADAGMKYQSIVGAGLLANVVCQIQEFCLTHRIREQARSHI